MKLFICWSGGQSKVIASAIKALIGDVLQTVELFMSEESIEKGTRWPIVLGQELEQTDAGLVCLTPENLSSEWIHFEAGSLAKSMERSRLFTYLYGLEKKDVRPPLNQFQHTLAERTETLDLVLQLKRVAAPDRTDEAVKSLFEKCWPDFEKKLQTMPPPGAGTTSTARSAEEMLEEILGHTRTLANILPSIQAQTSRSRFDKGRAEIFYTPPPPEPAKEQPSSDDLSTAVSTLSDFLSTWPRGSERVVKPESAGGQNLKSLEDDDEGDQKI